MAGLLYKALRADALVLLDRVQFPRGRGWLHRNRLKSEGDHHQRGIAIKPRRRSRAPQKYWSQDVTETSNALDLESGVFTQSSPKAIARSLKRSAEASSRRNP